MCFWKRGYGLYLWDPVTNSSFYVKSPQFANQCGSVQINALSLRGEGLAAEEFRCQYGVMDYGKQMELVSNSSFKRWPKTVSTVRKE